MKNRDQGTPAPVLPRNDDEATLLAPCRALIDAMDAQLRALDAMEACTGPLPERAAMARNVRAARDGVTTALAEVKLAAMNAARKRIKG